MGAIPETMSGSAREQAMPRRQPMTKSAKPAKGIKLSKSASASPYGYAHSEWLAKEDPEYAAARQPLSDLSIGEGKELSIKHREMVIIGILAFRGRQEGIVAHMRRAIQHGATKRELLEGIQAAAVPGGGPTLSAGVQALMQIEAARGFKNG
jgi:alkylhydroperoxidase/carboxymuconolactone decarboxylase family protein YurZ